MIVFLKENYLWLGATVIPIIVAIIGALAVINVTVQFPRLDVRFSI